jgi:hypothetical protein
VATATGVFIQVTTVNQPPAGASLTDATRWTIIVKGPQHLSIKSTPTGPVTYDPASGVVTLNLPRGSFGAADPSKCSWRVGFQGTAGARLEAAQDPAISDTFTLGSASGSVSGPDVHVRVRASGIAPAGGIVNNREYWRVQLNDSSGNGKAIQPVGRAEYSFSTGFVTLTFPASEMGPIRTSDVTWSAAFLTPDTTLTTAQTRGGGSALQQAKSRDDADLYLSGNYIAGVGTKPIWAIDAKAGYSDAPEKVPVVNWFVKSSPANLRFGIYGEMKTNVDAQPPVERTQLDPDSILGYATLFRTTRLTATPLLYGLKWEVQPVGGEFSRKYPASNLISGARVRLFQVLAAKRPVGRGSHSVVGVRGRQKPE